MANEEHLSILRQGVEVWNEWRRKNQEVIPDLGYTYLGSIKLVGANLKRACLEGTYLGMANLAAANLEGAILAGATLEKATLEGANLAGAYPVFANLTFAKMIGTNLKEASMWGTKMYGANLSRANLEGANLVGVNLEGADLEGASLVGIDLERASLVRANLERANLERAKLLDIQALRANFKNAILTGACIKDWHINADTNLEGVICEYVYRDWDAQRNEPKERQPYCGTYSPGDFTKIFQLRNVLETVEIFFSEGIDWQAFLKAFQNLQAKRSEKDFPICIQAIENKSGDAFVVRLEVGVGENKGNIQDHIKAVYELEKKLLDIEYRAELDAKDKEIEQYRQENTKLSNIVEWLSKKTMIVEANAMVSRDIYNQNNVGIGHMSGGEIKDQAKVAGTLNEAEQRNLAEAAAEIEQLLKQFSETYPTETVSQQMAVVSKVVEQVESNPTLMQKLMNAGKAGGIAALEAYLNHPLASFFIAAAQRLREDSK